MMYTGKWFVRWEIGTRTRAGVELDLNSWMFGIEVYSPVGYKTKLHPGQTQVGVRIGPIEMWVVW
jgi:hypothetical protein